MFTESISVSFVPQHNKADAGGKVFGKGGGKSKCERAKGESWSQ